MLTDVKFSLSVVFFLLLFLWIVCLQLFSVGRILFFLELVCAKGCCAQGAVVVGLLRLHLMMGQVGFQLHGFFCSSHLAHLVEV